MTIPVTLSTSSVYPGGVELTFALARDLGYDGVEVMVLSDPKSREAAELQDLVDAYQLPIGSIHAPTLLFTQRVWGGAWDKIDNSIELAQAVGASVVVLHPPFLWQRPYTRAFVDGVLEREAATGVVLAVENMYPWRVAKDLAIYRPHWDPIDMPYPSNTLDLSHAATSRQDGLAMAVELGSRLKHVHLCDGRNNFKDEHLVPGLGTQRPERVLEYLVETGYTGQVCVEVATRGKGSALRDDALARSLAFARRHLGQHAGPARTIDVAGLAVLRARYDDAGVTPLIDGDTGEPGGYVGGQGAGTREAADLEALKAPLWVATYDGELAGAVALIEQEDGNTELAVERVPEEFRGRGIGMALMAEVIAHARATDAKRINLVTGAGEEFAAARALYVRAGFSETGPFGDYPADPASIFMALEF